MTSILIKGGTSVDGEENDIVRRLAIRDGRYRAFDIGQLRIGIGRRRAQFFLFFSTPHSLCQTIFRGVRDLPLLDWPETLLANGAAMTLLDQGFARLVWPN